MFRRVAYMIVALVAIQLAALALMLAGYRFLYDRKGQPQANTALE